MGRLVVAAWVATGVGAAVASPVWLFLFAVAVQGMSVGMLGSSSPSLLGATVLVVAFAATFVPAIVASRYARDRPDVSAGAAVFAFCVHGAIGGPSAMMLLGILAQSIFSRH